MIFALLTLLSALSLGSVSGWFSIIGIMTIYAGAQFHALIMGLVLEGGKLVTASWLYRNWKFSSWWMKLPLIFLTIILSLITSIGVFGFLSKAHLEQNSSTIDNSAKIETLNQQIEREKSLIADNEKIINQLDSTINSYLGKDRTDRSVLIRKSQEPQRKQLRNDIDNSQKKIDELSSEKFKLESELRKLQLEVGPIRYISELIYGTDNSDKNIESAVKIFTLIISLTLEPLAVILLIAANHTFLRLKNEKENPELEEKDNKTNTSNGDKEIFTDRINDIRQNSEENSEKINEETKDIMEGTESVLSRNTESKGIQESGTLYRGVSTEETIPEEKTQQEQNLQDNGKGIKEASEQNTVKKFDTPHFIPEKLNEEKKKNDEISWSSRKGLLPIQQKLAPENKSQIANSNKYPRQLSWLKDFVGR